MKKLIKHSSGIAAALILLPLVVACSSNTPKESAAALTAAEIPASARNTFTFAVAAMHAKQWGEAESQLKSLMQAQPKLSGAYLNLALVYVETNRPGDAETQFKKAIEVNPDNMAAHNQYGMWLRTQGRFKDAEVTYLQSLQRKPNYADTHLNLGILYDLYLGKSAQALEQYQQYLSLQGETAAPEAEKVKSWVAELQRRNKSAS